MENGELKHAQCGKRDGANLSIVKQLVTTANSWGERCAIVQVGERKLYEENPTIYRRHDHEYLTELRY